MRAGRKGLATVEHIMTAALLKHEPRIARIDGCAPIKLPLDCFGTEDPGLVRIGRPPIDILAVDIMVAEQLADRALAARYDPHEAQPVHPA
ncbi:hypothetical protein D3C72_2033230 [compost metagenome]